MSEPKIAITKLPTSPAPPSPPVPPGPPSQPAKPSQPAGRSKTIAVLVALGLVVIAVVAGFFIYRTITLQSELTQTRNQSLQSQSQLEQARGELGKAQANAQGLSAEMAKLQAQLEQAKGESAAAKANAEKASADIARLQAQLEQARSEVADAKASVKKAAAEVARLQTQLRAQSQGQSKPAGAGTAPAKGPAANSREMPVSVSFQKPLVGDGTSLVLQNTSSNTLPVNVRFTDATSSTNTVYHLAIDGGASKELGSLGPWKLATGDKIEIESVNYPPIVKTAP